MPTTFETIPFPIAVRSSQIIADTSEGDFSIERKYPYSRITNWYKPFEHHLLERAINQLGKSKFLVVESVGGVKAIYRDSAEVIL